MARVPYTGVPERVPNGPATPSLHVNTPGAAFGESQATAMQGFGRQLERSGDELFARAIAIQTLQNETDAKNAVAQYDIEVGLKHAEYQSLVGEAAAKAYPQYQQDLEEARNRHRDNLSTDQARKMFDGPSLSTFGKTVASGAGHAATQMRVGAARAADARIAVAREGVSQPVTDEDFKTQLNIGLAELEAKADTIPGGQDEYDRMKTALISDYNRARIEGTAKSNPQLAKDLLERAKEGNQILSQDYEKAEKHVKHELYNTTARLTANAVNQGYAPYMKQSQIDTMKGVDDTLTRVLKRAQRDNPDLQIVPASHLAGKRTAEQQAPLVAAGYSKTMNSNHITGRAMDVGHVGPDGKISEKWSDQQKVETAMKKAFEAEGIPLGDEHDKIRSWDPGHFSLPRDYDTSKAPKEKPESMESKIERAVDEAKRIAPDDVEFHQMVRNRVESEVNHTKKIEHDKLVTNMDTVQSGLGGFADKSGKLPTTVDELRSTSGEVAAAYDALPDTKKNVVRNLLAKNSRQDVVETPERRQRYHELLGMASGPNADPKKFFDVDLGKEDLPRKMIDSLFKMQNRKYDQSMANPKVVGALQIIQRAYGDEVPRFKDNPTAANRFSGALQEALIDWKERTGKDPNADEIKAIGRELIKPIDGSGYFGTNFGREKMYEQSVPSYFSESWKKQFPNATDAEIQNEYDRARMQDALNKMHKRPDAKLSVPKGL